MKESCGADLEETRTPVPDVLLAELDIIVSLLRSDLRLTAFPATLVAQS